MTIAVFDNIEQLKMWCGDTVVEGRFRIISTDEGEIIVEPTKTSKPLKYGYLKIAEAEKRAEEISKEFNIKHIHISAYRWNDERGPFVKVPIEE